MTGNPASVSVLALAGCLVYLGLIATQGAVRAEGVVPAETPASSNSATAGDGLFAFDIPSLPLNVALSRYATITKRPALFRSEMVVGRLSSVVRGLYLPEIALRMLLQGTGLIAEQIAAGHEDVFVLREDDAVAQPQADGNKKIADLPYLSIVQARLWDTLCRSASTAPGNYRALLRFHLDATGQLQRARLLGSTGDAHRDAAILNALRRVRMDSTPPLSMPQPVTILILPRDADGTQHCVAEGGRR